MWDAHTYTRKASFLNTVSFMNKASPTPFLLKDLQFCADQDSELLCAHLSLLYNCRRYYQTLLQSYTSDIFSEISPPKGCLYRGI